MIRTVNASVQTFVTPDALSEMIGFLKAQLDADERKAAADGDGRTLGEVKRWRNIVTDCEFYVHHNRGPSWEAPMLAVGVLKELTAMHEGRPGYQEMWRPASDG